MATTDDFTENGQGLKRICQSCGEKYYDLNKDPIICPNCGTEFDPEAVLSSRRGRVTEETAAKTEKDADAEDKLDPDLEEVVVADEEGDDDDKFKDTGNDDTLLVEEDDEDDALGGLAVASEDGDDDN